MRWMIECKSDNLSLLGSLCLSSGTREVDSWSIQGTTFAVRVESMAGFSRATVFRMAWTDSCTDVVRVYLDFRLYFVLLLWLRASHEEFSPIVVANFGAPLRDMLCGNSHDMMNDVH